MNTKQQIQFSRRRFLQYSGLATSAALFDPDGAERQLWAGVDY